MANDPELKAAVESFVDEAEITLRGIEILEASDPAAADAAMKRLCAIVDETANEMDRIHERHNGGSHV